jgi:hypothetical protein
VDRTAGIQSGVPVLHPIQTGSVRIKRAQAESRGNGMARSAHILFDRDWSEWLPIFAWAIEHEEGVIVVDTGETASATAPGLFSTLASLFPDGGALSNRTGG